MSSIRKKLLQNQAAAEKAAGPGDLYPGKAATYLMNTRIMSPMTEAEALAVLQYMHPFVIPAGEPFILEDDEAHNDYLMLILEGDVVVEASMAEHRSLTVNVVPPGRWVGELAMLDGLARQAACRAGDDVDVLCAILTRESYLRLLHEQPALAAKLTLVLAFNVTRFLRDVQQKLVRFAEIYSAQQQMQSSS